MCIDQLFLHLDLQPPAQQAPANVPIEARHRHPLDGRRIRCCCCVVHPPSHRHPLAAATCRQGAARHKHPRSAPLSPSSLSYPSPPSVADLAIRAPDDAWRVGVHLHLMYKYLYIAVYITHVRVEPARSFDARVVGYVFGGFASINHDGSAKPQR